MRPAWIAPLLLLGLCACNKEKETENGAPPLPPDAAVNFSQPIDAHGGDPAWTLTVRGTQLTLVRPGQPDVTAKALGATITSHSAAWTAALPDGQTMKVSLYASPCVEGAGSRGWPMAAEVALSGASPLGGCAGPAGKP
ncbi:hypothetical protein [Phenylobacterium sp.]|uniref:hypothetical protein n=1 Tax=Phenylobacterium sp. TaxID=1871053 RepID=UPI00121F4DAC|nr:hypothetical protein [Phenylobacterium sp.]THD71719.1 MAG: hypothetical protein E8A12_01380 [Phenylobacterium sp.]